MNPQIVMAPLSNDPLRDWPMAYYRELARLCVDQLDAVVSFVGTRSQRPTVARAVRDLDAARYRNLCGSMSWSETTAFIRDASCVAANNSGIAHLAAGLGVATVCIFGASHNPLEWMARGPRVTTLIKKTGCSPCAIGTLDQCPFDQRCLKEIKPEQVFPTIRREIGRPATRHA